jgi:hypothetical protein
MLNSNAVGGDSVIQGRVRGPHGSGQLFPGPGLQHRSQRNRKCQSPRGRFFASKHLICGGQGKLTVLMVAAKWARVETVKVLLTRGAKLNAIDEVRALSTLSH